jgi:hypothetical protein
MAGFQTLVNGQTSANSHEHTKSTSFVAHLNKEGLKRSFSSHTRHPAKDYMARKQATQDQSAASHKKQRLPRRPRTVASEPNMSLAEHIRHNARQIVGRLFASLPYCMCVFKISLVLTAAVFNTVVLLYCLAPYRRTLRRRYCWSYPVHPNPLVWVRHRGQQRS